MSKLIGRTVSCLLLWFVASAAVAQEPKLPPEAVAAIQAEKWDEVIKLLGGAAGDASSGIHAVAVHWVGAAYYHTGDHARATQHLSNAMRADPACRATALMLASLAEAGPPPGRTRLADWVQELQQLWGHDGDVMYSIGRGYMANHMRFVSSRLDAYSSAANRSLPLAIECFRQAERLGTTRVANARWLAFLLYHHGQFEEAVEYSLQALKRGAVSYDTYLILAGALTSLRRDAEAEAAYAEALRLAPGKSDLVQYERGKALCRSGRYNEAIEAFRDVLSKSWAQANVRHWIGISALGAKKHRLAMWAFIDSHTVDDRVDALYYMGRCAYAASRYDLAEKYFQQACDTFVNRIQTRRVDKAPSDWVHYLGRAQWAQKKYDEALKKLAEAFDRRRSSPLYARWLYHAYLARDDVHSAIDVCYEWGRYSANRPRAIEGIQNILKRWPQPRMQDMLARKLPHVNKAHHQLARLYELDRRYRTAAEHYAQARETSGRLARVQAGWVLTHVGRLKEAEQCFRDYIRYYKSKDYGRHGLGTVLLMTGRHAEAVKELGQIERESMLPSCDTGRLYAAMAAGEATARQLADPYTLLGQIEGSRLGAGRGEKVLAILPGSVLAAVKPSLLPDDVLLSVDGKPLGTREQTAILRKSAIPDKPVEARVRRGQTAFSVMLDYRPQVAKLPTPAATQPATEEVTP
ncbi:MAG TPA: tetratricopeptide repeat protein [Phycisphaerae bacterium]|nr:tetratricopeptide repeat protein [Phycisphaerae bacterium]